MRRQYGVRRAPLTDHSGINAVWRSRPFGQSSVDVLLIISAKLVFELVQQSIACLELLSCMLESWRSDSFCRWWAGTRINTSEAVVSVLPAALIAIAFASAANGTFAIALEDISIRIQ